MEDTELKEIFIQQLPLLPVEVKNFLRSSEWKEGVSAIAAHHTLTEDQAADLEIETLLVMLAIDDFSRFKTSIQSKLGVPEDIAAQISSEIENKVLAPIKMRLIIFQDELPVVELADKESGLSILDTKLNNVARNTPDTIKPVQGSSQAQKSEAGVQTQENIPPASPPRYASGTDPYREQI